MNIDLQLFFFIVGGGLFFSAAIFFMIEKNAANSLRGGKSWGIGNLSLFVGFILIGLRGVIPDFFSIVFADTMLVNAAVFYYISISDVAGRTYNLKLLLAALSFAFLIGIYFTYIQPDYSARMLALLALSFFIISLTIRQLLTIKEPELAGPVNITTVIMGGLNLLFLWRGFFEIINYSPDNSFLSSKMALGVIVSSAFVGATLLTISFVLLSNASNYLSVQRMAYEDSLTKIFSRRAIMDRLNSQLSLTNRTGIPFTIVLIDFDNLKLINDRFGHLAGDEALKKIASTIKASLRVHDSVGRMGGDEFAIVLSNTNLKGAEFVVQRLLKEIRELKYSFNEQVFVSMGGAQYDMDDGKLDDLIGKADKNLYQAKDEGGNYYFFGN